MDYEPVPDFTIEIAPGAQSGTATFTLTPMPDTVGEKDEELTLSGASDLEVESAVLVLGDDDEASLLIRLSAAGRRRRERGCGRRWR